MKDPYEKTARSYDTYVEPFNTVLRKIVLKMFDPGKEMRVLEVGCGTGTNLKLYHEAGCRVHGMDLSPAMLQQARGKLGRSADLRLADASYMPYPDGGFDLAVSMLTLHEMPASIRPAVMSEMIRVVKRDGRILLIDFHPGPISFPKGWLYKTLNLFFEIAAGREHFGNYRDFLVNNGLPGLISSHELSVEKKKIVGGGTMGLFLLSVTY